jgi:hypothetical protein
MKGWLSFWHWPMSSSATPGEDKEESTMIDPEIGKKIFNMKFESGEVGERSVWHIPSACLFAERFDCFVISNMGCIEVILSRECLFAQVSPL